MHDNTKASQDIVVGAGMIKSKFPQHHTAALEKMKTAATVLGFTEDVKIRPHNRKKAKRDPRRRK